MNNENNAELNESNTKGIENIISVFNSSKFVKEPWMRIKSLKVNNGIKEVTLYHGPIPREFRHPDEYGNGDGNTSKGTNSFYAWEDAIGVLASSLEKNLPKGWRVEMSCQA